MMRPVLLLLLAIVVAYAQNGVFTLDSFTATVYIRESRMQNGGALVANMEYYAKYTDPDLGRDFFNYKLTFPSKTGPAGTYTEIYSFNAEQGRATVNPFRSQYLFRTGGPCPTCDIASITYGMPPLSFSSAIFTPVGTPQFLSSFGGWTNRTCQPYSINAAFRSNIASIMFTVGPNPKPCYVRFTPDTIVGTRDYYFDNVQYAGIGAPAVGTIPPPSDCKCSKPLDVVLVLDRSASISRETFLDQRNFVIQFVQQFEISPVATNIALVHYHTYAWEGWSLAQGSNAATVLNYAQQMTCCNENSIAQCCHKNANQAAWTSTGSGMILGQNVLSRSTRSNAPKIMIVVTDGFANVKTHTLGEPLVDDLNTLLGSTANPALPNGNYAPSTVPYFCFPKCTTSPNNVEGSAEWTACIQQDNAAVECNRNLIATVATIPSTTTIYAIGVGPLVNRPQLSLIARQIASNVLTVNDFTELAKTSLEIVSRACDANAQPCGSTCCSFCACRTCLAPDFCDDADPCTAESLGPVCCKADPPPTCAGNVNKCIKMICYEKLCQPQIGYQACPPNNTCGGYSCVPETGNCTFTPSRDLQNGFAWNPSTNRPNYCRQVNCVNNALVTTDVSTSCRTNDKCLSWSCDATADSVANRCKYTAVPRPTTGFATNVCQNPYCDPASTSATTPWVLNSTTCPPASGPCQTSLGCNAALGGCQYRPTCTAPADGASNKCYLASTTATPFCNTNGACNFTKKTCPDTEPGIPCNKRSNAWGTGNGAGCNPATGECVYTPLNCPPSSCRITNCSTASGTCQSYATPGCLNGLCDNAITNACQARSDICVTRICDVNATSTTDAALCSVIQVRTNCTRDSRSSNRCLILRTSVISPNDRQPPQTPLSPGCNASNTNDPCVFDPVVCAPPAPCEDLIRDPNTPGCCVYRARNCTPTVGYNPCSIYSCDTSADNCTVAPKCPTPSDNCNIRTCDAGTCNSRAVVCTAPSCQDVRTPNPCDVATGCVFVPRVCTPRNLCESVVCDVNTNNCSYTTNTCDDGNVCTLDSCDLNNGQCVHVPRVCNDNNPCTIDVCNFTVDQTITPDGCVYTPVPTDYCDDQSQCTTDICDASLPSADPRGCNNIPIDCNVTSKCSVGVCHRFEGCLELPSVCYPMGSNPGQNSSCINSTCSVDRRPAAADISNYTRSLYAWQNAYKNGNTRASPPRNPYCQDTNIRNFFCDTNNLIIAGSLGAAAIAGIIIGIALCVGCAGGGVYAVANNKDLGKDASVMNNPLYNGAGTAHTNPLSRH